VCSRVPNSLAITALLSGVAVAQDSKEPDKPKTQDTAKQDAPKQDAKKEDAKTEESKVATAEVTPAQASAEAGDKVQFKAIGRDVKLCKMRVFAVATIFADVPSKRTVAILSADSQTSFTK
jgi:hypothetical protein